MTGDEMTMAEADGELPGEIRGLVAKLDERGRKFIALYDGTNRAAALDAAGLRQNAFHMRLTRSEPFRRVVNLIDEARRSVVAHQVASTLAPEAEPLVNELKGIALGPATGARALDAKLRAILACLRILGIATESPSPLVQISQTSVTIDQRALQLWHAGGAEAWRSRKFPAAPLEVSAATNDGPPTLEAHLRATKVRATGVEPGGTSAR